MDIRVILCVIDFVRMASDWPNEYMRDGVTREEWVGFVWDMESVIRDKWGLRYGPSNVRR